MSLDTPTIRVRRRTMPAPLKAALVAPALLVAILGSAACDVALSGFREEESDTWTRSYPLSASGRVEIGNTNGFIEVTAGSGQSVDVKAVRVARAASKESAKAMLSKALIREEISADLVKLTTERPAGGWGHGGGVEIRYTVTVPASAIVELQTTNGHIGVTNVTAGLKAGTTNGEIDGRGLSGAVRASTTNGSVDLELASLSGDVNVSTTNGEVNVRVPADAKATISTRWTNGGVDVSGLTVQETEKSRRRFDGRLNGGGPRIDIETTNGGITLGKR
jgi:Putative adhesin